MIPFLDFLSPIIEKALSFIPDPKMKAEAQLKLTEELNRNQEVILTALSAVDQKQAEINASDSASSDKFKSYWRPAISWVCVLAFAWEYVIQPITVFVLTLCKVEVPLLPKLDMSTMMPVLIGVLGLGAMRSVDKKNGVN
jgi:hypothetical protein